MMKKKPKTNHKGNKGTSEKYDRCQTPFYALDPLLPYLNKDWLIWESAAGEGQIVQKLTSEGFSIHGTDLLDGHNFFVYEPAFWNVQVTNPPYSIKYEWLERSYQLGKPFALLLPWETWATESGQYWFENYGVEVILLDKRVNFKMPNKGYNGKGSYFPVAWFTWQLNLGRPIVYGKVNRYKDDQPSFLPEKIRPAHPQIVQVAMSLFSPEANSNKGAA